ncbi:glycosyltransferase family 4 protein [Amphritea sp. 1_MG-2023]|uniref:glycosyltransferase family 4 protein n=1 Tax=Amphritea sp. 1_MG-2023 TaxID=3062670 RepID=UPI0026E11C2A|nr:glycosyltransferase family 4 protein [Amphritea sp. 1_MG-2023]MDO6563994.1 glycosyltransferase family 4 protein [Amphritea sp. 1_MG-2023]
MNIDESNKTKILVFGPDSIHTFKFIKMIVPEYDVTLITDGNSNSYLCRTIVMSRGIKMFFEIPKIIKEVCPDYIHVHTINRVTFPLCFLAPSNIPIVLSAWGSSVLVIPYISWFHKKFVQYCLNKSSVITVDANIEQYVIERLVDDKVVREANFGIDDSYLNLLDDSNSVKENIIYSPRSHSNIYNIGKVIDGFVKFSKSNPEWRLILGGFEHEENTSRYKEIIKSAGLSERVLFKGFVSPEENLKLNIRSKIVVSVPHSDGKSHSVMEAISSGAICFVSDIPSNHELIMQGVNGFFVESNEKIDFSLFSEIDMDLLESVNKKLVTGFSFSVNSYRFKQVYENL